MKKTAEDKSPGTSRDWGLSDAEEETPLGVVMP